MKQSDGGSIANLPGGQTELAELLGSHESVGQRCEFHLVVEASHAGDATNPASERNSDAQK